MEILDDEEHNDTVAWLPHGQGFMIYKKKAFEINVMSRFFKQSKFTSFTRKLNRWGFTRVTRGPETGAYYHKFFKRGQPRLCLQMSCQSSKAQPETWMKPQAGMMGGPAAAPQMGGLMMPGLTPNPAGVSSLMGAAAAAAGSNALLQQQLLQLQQQQALQQLQQQELLRRAMASQTSNSLYLQLLQGKTSGSMGTDPMLMAQLQSTARNAAAAAAAGNPIAFGSQQQQQQQQFQQQQQQQQLQQLSRSENNNTGSPDSTRSAGEIRRAMAA